MLLPSGMRGLNARVRMRTGEAVEIMKFRELKFHLSLEDLRGMNPQQVRGNWGQLLRDRNVDVVLS